MSSVLVDEPRKKLQQTSTNGFVSQTAFLFLQIKVIYNY